MRHLGGLCLACTMAACTFAPVSPLEPPLLDPDAATAPPDAAIRPPADARAVADAEPPGDAPFCDPDDDALVACFGFEDAIQDGAGAGLVITAENVSFGEGWRGRGLITTAESLVRLTEAPVLDVSALTLELWVYPDALPASGRAGLFDNDGQYGMFVFPAGLVQCTGAAAPIQLANAVEAGRWTHLACTNDGQTAILYVDGQARASGPTAPLNRGTNNGSAIGGNLPSGDPFLGRIDELRIWSRVRTAEEVCAAAGCAGP